MAFWEGKFQEMIIFMKTRTIMVTLRLKLVLLSEPDSELLEIFLKLSMKTVIIGMTLDWSNLVYFCLV